ncbi:MAG: hypothetical protein JOZ07_19830 [Solirubrobacterales bacterium]|nr:hypothetical protein [Solirubrobacterales bacterium]
MISPSSTSRRRLGPSRRLCAAPVLGLLAAAALLVAPAVASADTSQTLSVIGTSDVSDSGLVQNVIQPLFHAAYPQYAFKYTGSATGAAIQNAEAGNGGPSVLIVHAASLENQFVAGGYSYQNRYGNAIFTNDFVLAGPTADASHANVLATAPHNIAAAFAEVAAAGAAGTATFDSRGGAATAPGTTVAEHQIWALVNSSGLKPDSLTLCTVSAADGGGMTPIANGAGIPNGGACPDAGTVSAPANLPTWYVINAGNQANNVIAANACTAGNGAGTCYVFTDRGTYDNLASAPSTTATPGLIPNLQIVTRDNAATAPGGPYALINYFHAYIINPAKPGQAVNLPAAIDFVNLLTSPTLQSRLSQYLSATGDPGGAPFVASASPGISASGLPATANAGQKITISGTVTNSEPGYPPISGKPVTVDEIEGTLPVPVATGTTNASGGYSVTFSPPSSGIYQVTTGDISQIEIPTLSPPFGDILSPGASAATTLSLNGAATIRKTSTSTGSVQAAGTVGPAAPDGNATVTLQARGRTSRGAFRPIGSQTLSAGSASYALNGALRPGKYTIRVVYQDKGLLNTATSTTRNVTVPPNSTRLTFGKTTIKAGRLTLKGSVGTAPTKNATVRLFALSIGRVSIIKGKIVLAAKGATFKQIAKATVKKGKRSFTIRHKLARGQRYVLQLEYTVKGEVTSFSNYKYIDVH